MNDIIARHSARSRVKEKQNLEKRFDARKQPKQRMKTGKRKLRKKLGVPKPLASQAWGIYEGSSKRTKLSFGVLEKDP